MDRSQIATPRDALAVFEHAAFAGGPVNARNLVVRASGGDVGGL